MPHRTLSRSASDPDPVRTRVVEAVEIHTATTVARTMGISREALTAWIARSSRAATDAQIRARVALLAGLPD